MKKIQKQLTTNQKEGKNENKPKFNEMLKIARNLTWLRLLSSRSASIDWTNLKFKTKVPQQAVKPQFLENITRTKISEEDINLLERLSLVDLERKLVLLN